MNKSIVSPWRGLIAIFRGGLRYGASRFHPRAERHSVLHFGPTIRHNRGIRCVRSHHACICLHFFPLFDPPPDYASSDFRSGLAGCR